MSNPTMNYGYQPQQTSGIFGGGSSPATGQMQANQPATELEGILATLADKLSNIHHNVYSIYSRVLPPTPQGATTSGPTPVSTTYAQKVGDLIALSEMIQSMSAELNGRI